MLSRSLAPVTSFVAAVAVVALTSTGALAQAEVTMTYASATPVTENNFAWTHHEVMAREIEARSGGRIDVQMFPGSQLGGIESLVNQVQDGIIQAADPADGHFASTFPDIQDFGIP